MAFNASSSAARNGFSSNLEAVDHAAHINQFLGTHNVTPIYNGVNITGGGTGGNGQHLFVTTGPPNANDHSAPFTMPASKTVIGRVAFPVVYTGNGGDLYVALCNDVSGSPNTASPIASTIVPSSWTTNLTTQGTLSTGVGPMAVQQYNVIMLQNDYSFTWSQPAIGPGGAAQFATPCTSGLYGILSGGYTGSAAATTVATVQSLGGGVIGNPVLQPSLPQAVYYHMMTTTSDTILVAGGTNGTAFYSNVWTASWDANTGTIGAWTAQPSLPHNIIQGCAANWNNYVYITGGNADLTPASAYTNVYYSQVVNGQVQGWKSATSLPLGLQVHFCGAVNNWLIVAGGQNSSGTTQTGTYVARIYPDGSLGGWITWTPLPTGVYALGAQWSYAVSDSGMHIFSGNTASGTYSSRYQSMTVQDLALGSWFSQDAGVAGAYQVFGFPHGEPGNFQLNPIGTTNYLGADTTVTPLVSAPLYATGLTPGNTYHVVIRNLRQDSENYTQLYAAASGGSTYLSRAPYTNGAWIPEPNGRTIPVLIYDNTPGTGSLPWHAWSDPDSNNGNLASQTSTYAYDRFGRVLGYCEETIESMDPLNQNTLTTNGTSPWTPTNATLASTQAQVHGGYAYSGLLTPNGTSALAYASSELIQISPRSPAYTVSSWFYAATSITSNISLSVNWFDSTQTYISTSSNIQSLGAATWTYFSNVYAPPSGAAYMTIVPTLSGTPSAGNPLYISYITSKLTDPEVVASVAQIVYPGNSQPNLWPPTGINQLA